MAARLREKSKNYSQVISRRTMDATLAGIHDYLQRYKVSQLIHGHTHQPALHYFKHAGQLAQRFVLSDWDEQGSVLVCWPTGEKRLIKITGLSSALPL